MSEPHPNTATLLSYADEVEQATAGRLEYAALALALALPDICASLQSDDRETNKYRYADWCEKHGVASRSKHHDDLAPFMTGADLWDLRCKFLHNGSPDLRRHESAGPEVLRLFRLSRTEHSPGGGSVRVRDWTNGHIESSASSICMDIARGVRTWVTTNSGNAIVQRNLDSVLNLDAWDPL